MKYESIITQKNRMEQLKLRLLEINSSFPLENKSVLYLRKNLLIFWSMVPFVIRRYHFAKKSMLITTPSQPKMIIKVINNNKKKNNRLFKTKKETDY